MSAAAHAAALNMPHILLEKTDHLSDTIFKYQLGKHIMATPSQLVLRSDVGFDAGTRENTLEMWQSAVDTAGVNIRYNSEVTAITGAKGDFKLTLGDGTEISAENVIMAIGTQGNPNRMREPGGDLPFIQYQLDDPKAHFDENIIVIGGGDAGIENALGLCADADQGNRVTLLQRAPDFPRAKDANVKALLSARDQGRMDVMTSTSTVKVEPGWITVSVNDGEERLRCDRIIARIGSAPPRRFVEGCGIEFSSPDREAFPVLSSQFEATTEGIYVIGALAGYPLIKHCMNQGYDVIEFINGNDELKPADEVLFVEKFKKLPNPNDVSGWLDTFRESISIFNPLSELQIREFMLDSDVKVFRPGQKIFERNDIGTSLFTISKGSVEVEVDPNDPSKTVRIEQGSIFGEIGLISGRRRGATIRATESCILVEVPRSAARKLMSTVPAVKTEIDKIATERSLLQIFGSGLTPADVNDVLQTAEIMSLKSGDVLINEGETSRDIFIIRYGSMVVEKLIGGKPVFLNYLPAGSYVGEIALLDNGQRTATVKAAIKSEIIKLNGDLFEALLNRNERLKAKLEDKFRERRNLNAHIEAQKASFNSVVDLNSSVANFLVEQGLGEATDALLIDETMCVGCDNCERACADSHEGISRLDREAGVSFANIHVPTSCRHCEHPHCMSDCPPDAIRRAPHGEVYINDSCIGCGNCQRNCPYGVIQMEKVPPRKPNLLNWLLFGTGPGPGQPDAEWIKGKASSDQAAAPKKAVKCDMCMGIDGGPACVRACPTGAAVRVSPEQYLTAAKAKD